MREIPLKALIAYGVLCLGLMVGSVWAQGVNIAQGKTATASSVWDTAAGSTADKAVDGIAPASYANIWHSGSGDRTPWWQVDLAGIHLIQRIVIWNRQDCCQNRLRDITVQIQGPANEVLFETLVNPGDILGGPPTITITPNVAVPGRFVRVSRTEDNVNLSGDDQYLLQLAEVQVYAVTPMKAFNPSPEIGAVRVGVNTADIGTVETILGWYSGMISNPSDPNVVIVDPFLVKHVVYISNAGSDDPNDNKLGEIPAGSPVAPTAQFGPITLNRDIMYYWRVDEVRMVDGNEQIVKGTDWTFTTESSKPIFAAGLPANAFAWSAESAAPTGDSADSATFSAQAQNPYSDDATGLNYQWFKVKAGGDVKVAEGSATFTIPAVTNADAGEYYCVATVTDPATGASSESSRATLSIKHVVGYWPFDGDFVDKVAGNNGIAVGQTVTFGQGIVRANGDLGQAVKFDGLDGAAAQAVHMSSNGVPPQSSFTITLWENTTSASRTGYFFASSDAVYEAGRPVGYEYIYIWRRAADDHYVGFNCGFNFSINGAYGDIYGIPRQQWNLCTFVYDYTLNQYHYYVNGIDLTGAVGISGRMEDFVADFYVGNRENLGRAYEGLIDDFRIYDFAMDPQEIAELYLKSAGGYFCWTPVANDLNGDCIINLGDLMVMASNWMNCNFLPEGACQ